MSAVKVGIIRRRRCLIEEAREHLHRKSPSSMRIVFLHSTPPQKPRLHNCSSFNVAKYNIMQLNPTEHEDRA
jgi:hypothetical protein